MYGDVRGKRTKTEQSIFEVLQTGYSATGANIMIPAWTQFMTKCQNKCLQNIPEISAEMRQI
jgi:hypothetical protein